ncbi:MAG: HAMP domain-containing sensor histidine kinase [Bacteroidota bacterium]
MSGNFKIRLLLLMLAIGFACTALTIDFTINKLEVLHLDGQKIERRLHRKEEFVKEFVNNPANRDSLRNITKNEVWAQYAIKELSEKRNIYIQTFESGKLKFWSGIKIILETDTLLKEGSTFIPWENGYYEAIKKSEGKFSVVCYIPVMAKYPYQNEYLKNEFARELIQSENLEIAGLNDNDVYNIRNVSGKYLFSVKLKPNVTNTFYTSLELWMWVLSMIFAFIFVTQLCTGIANRGKVRTATLLLAVFILFFRLMDLEFRWFANHFDIEIFNPKYYASNYFSPSLGEFLLNVLSFTWVLAFIHSYRFQILKTEEPLGKLLSCIIFVLVGFIVCAIAFATNDAFYGLVTNSNISFDVTNVLNSNWLSWVGILIFGFSTLNLYLIIDSAIAISDSLALNNKERLFMFAGGLFVIFIDRVFFSDFNIFFFLFAMILLISGWAYYRYNGKFNPGAFVICLLLFAVIGSLKLSRFQFLKERESRKILAAKLESSGDPNAVLLFFNIEKEILEDKFVIDYFKNPLASQGALNNRLVKLYMAGYLSRYDFAGYEYDERDMFFKGDGGIALSSFKNLVLKGSVKVSEYFYRKNNTFGFQHYFALLPVRDSSNVLGTLVLELTSKRHDQMGAFPELLVDGKIKEDVQLKDYSYAYYNDGLLLNQHGKYVYNLRSIDFKGKVKDFVFVNNIDDGKRYNHLIYQANQRKLIVISKEVNNLLTQLASASFIFLVLLFFAMLVYVLQWLWYSVQNYDIRFRNFRWNYLITTNRMLYKTRIQFSMVSAVVVTLLITGLITYYNISQQYRQQQEETVLDKITKISAGFNKQLLENDILAGNEQAELAFNTYADVNGADLNLFDLEGKLIHSTQPKIYENGLIARRMNSLSYLYLNRLQKSEYINTEQIGDLTFLAAYVPLRNSKNEPIAYLGLPYFSNERDYEDRVGLFLNALLNVYALVFVAIGFFAVFVANRITTPLTMVQKSLSETKIGRKNEPILWKRNDEIGNLIKEYNTMIAALEESAQKLARSERENAWREMAKQVAHEIKNPLTPLKLGVQLLDRSWKEKDPNFDAKFEKFSKSFIEQIESLSHIASEFSNFAKMPEIVLNIVDLKEVLSQSVELYIQSEHTTIKFDDNCDRDVSVRADRDQLLRCFNNLIKNAIEARQDNVDSVVDVVMYCQENQVLVEIRDNGSGIPEALGQSIFTPNFTTKSSGTGLGLAFVKQAIENIDGSISFNTFPGKGTTFFIRIPMVNS